MTARIGRSTDIGLTSGGTVKVHPLTSRSPLAGIRALREYRVVHGAGGLQVETVIGDGDAAGVLAEIETRLRKALMLRGVEPPRITANAVAQIPRHPARGSAS